MKIAGISSEIGKYSELVLAVLLRLEKELPAELCYHNCAHTREVINAALFLAKEDNCSLRDTELILMAATFHDIGFLVARKGHEEESAKMAVSTLGALDFTDEELSLVSQMIRDTCLVQQNGTFVQCSHTRLSPYLLDPDLDNFGSKNFLVKTELVREELKIPKGLVFYDGVEKLVSAHKWLSESAKRNWQVQKEANLILIHNIVESYK